jgi:DNA repair exonuclease SbcCD ATPase subunit
VTDVSYEPAPLTILRLEVDNVKRLKSVRITPDGALVVIGGRNAQGKSSLLDAIEMAIGGGGSIPAEPIRRGARTARIVADLGDLVVERTFTQKGSQLVVKNAAGVPQKSPQALLDALCARIAFDPLAFERMAPKEQARIIRELDSDTAEAIGALELRRVDAFNERTEANRAAKAIAARLDPMVHHHDAPAAEVSVASLAERLEAGLAKNKERALAERRVENEQRAIDACEATIRRLEEDLARERHRLQQTRAALVAAEEAVGLTEAVDVAPIQQELRGAEATNRKVRANQERALVEEELKTATNRGLELTEEIEQLDRKKFDLLAAAKLPVPGLGFDDEGPTLNGLALEQASQAERLRVSIAIGIALNPKLKVLLVRDGSLLDEASTRLLAELARDAEAQVWLERVSEDGAGCSVVIEDGEARAEPKAAE